MSGPITVAGTLVEHPLQGVLTYLQGRESRRIFEELHLRTDPSPDHLSREDISLTRRMRARITDAEADWLVERGQSAPWQPLESSTDLRSASPDTDLGRSLLGRGFDLYRHFLEDRPPPGIGPAKVHKVLHLKRPAFVPIVDRRQHDLYRDTARDKAEKYHPDLIGDWDAVSYWLAIRDDLEASTEGLVELRTEVIASAEWATLGRPDSELDRVTDLALLDIVAEVSR